METEPYVFQKNYSNPRWFGDVTIRIYAPEYYIPAKRMGELKQPDDYSKKILLSKNEDLSDFFLKRMTQMWDDIHKQRGEWVDLVVPLPCSAIGIFSPTILPLSKKFARQYGYPFENIIQREHSILPNTFFGADDRAKNNRKSMILSRPLKETEETIVIVDDIKSTGSTALEAARVLLDAGAFDVILLCLGITAKDSDMGEIVGDSFD